MKRLLVILAALVAWCAYAERAIAATTSVPSVAPKRVAFVIGNQDYRDVLRLRTPRNDAQDVASQLKQLGFAVTTGIDLTRAEMSVQLSQYARQAQAADLSFFYFSGHGVQIRGTNYLLAVDAKVTSEDDVTRAAIPLDQLQGLLEGASGTNILVLDACSDNPFVQRSRSLERGLVEPALGRQTPRANGTFIAFAASPGTIAFDTLNAGDRNSAFTAALLKYLRTPNISVDEMFRRVQAEVAMVTNQRQRPYYASSVQGQFYLAQSDAAQSPTPISEVRPQAPTEVADLLSAPGAKLNGESITFLGREDISSRVEILDKEGLLRRGLNALRIGGADVRLWYESKKLERFLDPYKKSYAVIVAIDDYGERQNRTGFRDLDFMVQTARTLKAKLLALGFPESNILEMYDGQATSQKVDSALRDFWPGGKYGDADRMLFYYGGHGDSIALKDDGSGQPRKAGILVTYDHTKSAPARTSFLLDDLIHKHFEYLGPNHILALIDACSSGLALPRFQAKSPDEEGDEIKRFKRLSAIRADTSNPARNLLVAGTGEERALWVNGGIFSQALLRGLSGAADINEDGIVQFDELALYVRNEVTSFAGRAAGVMQVPVPFARGSGRVLFVLPSK